jgi:predicted O-methyltransferase YrrM
MKHIALMKTYAKENHIPIIEDEGLAFLEKLIKENQVLNILEIGSAIGYSAIMMALIDNQIMVDTIERDAERYQLAQQNIKAMHLTEQINLYHDDALTFDVSLLTSKYDLIFIDAAKAQYQKFFTKYEPLLKDDGVIAIDNVNFHGFVDHQVAQKRNTRQLANKIRHFRDWLATNDAYEVTKYDVGDGIMVARKV